MPFDTDRTRYGKDSALLTRIEQQHKFLLAEAAHLAPCPICRVPVNNYTATRDAFSVEDRDPPPFRCQSCGAELSEAIHYQGVAGRAWVLTKRQSDAIVAALVGGTVPTVF